MHNAPAVSYPVGRSHFQMVLILVVVLAGALVQGVWWLQSVERGLSHVLGGLFWMLSVGWVYWTVRRTPTQQLVWDGQEWRLHSGVLSRLVTPQVILDSQHSMLLCLRPTAGLALWAWPAQNLQPERWLALRRALFNPALHPDRSGLPGSPEV